MKVIMMMAQSLDGIIARHHRHFPDWTCPADKALFKATTLQARVMIMGSRTYLTIGKALPDRLNVVYTRYPGRYEAADNVRFTDKPPAALLEELSRQGFSQAVLVGGATLNSLFARDRLIHEIMVTISPKLFGQGLSMFAEPMEMDLQLIECRTLDPDTIFLHYRVKGAAGDSAGQKKGAPE